MSHNVVHSCHLVLLIKSVIWISNVCISTYGCTLNICMTWHWIMNMLFIRICDLQGLKKFRLWIVDGNNFLHLHLPSANEYAMIHTCIAWNWMIIVFDHQGPGFFGLGSGTEFRFVYKLCWLVNCDSLLLNWWKWLTGIFYFCINICFAFFWEDGKR